jgi:hypothetical protein
MMFFFIYWPGNEKLCLKMRTWCILVSLLSPSPLLLTQGDSADTLEPLTTGTPQIEYYISVLYLYCKRHILLVTMLPDNGFYYLFGSSFNQCCGSGFIDSGSGASLLAE